MAQGGPGHVGIIMDGNRRWARRHRLRSLLGGHEAGAERFIDVCGWCIEEGVGHLTVYAFSTENWGRGREEVEGLMGLVKALFVDRISLCMEKGIRVRVAGNRGFLPGDVLSAVEFAEERTGGNSSLSVWIALSYGGRDEIVRAVRGLCGDVAAGRVSRDAIDESVFGGRLDTGGAPEIDLVIRTGGQRRLSNFFPWQTVYSEICFLDVLWPDFSREMFVDALAGYRKATLNRGK